MGDNLDLTLAALFKGEQGVSMPTVAKTAPTSQLAAAQAAETAGKMPSVMASASGHYSRALEALREGDWTRFGTEMQQLGAALGHSPAHH
jgi:uncharacterized membrane protein (UPF0182 family)